MRSLRVETLESRQVLAADWRNPVDAFDVNHDRQVTAFDATAIINELNLNGPHSLATPRPAAAPFLDVNNSRNVTAFDAILVINRLNKQPVSPNYQLTEQSDSLLSETSITITTGGVSGGTRLYKFKVQSEFDLTDTGYAPEDQFLAYLINPAKGQTVIDSGTLGSAFFTLSGEQAELHSGLVQWDGTFVTLDLSQFNSTDTLELRLQLLNFDSDHGSRVTITPWSNALDPQGVPLSPGASRPLPAEPGESVAIDSTYAVSDLEVELANAAYDASTGKFTAEARAVNKSPTSVRNVLFSLPNLDEEITAANASGESDGVPYWSFAGVPDSEALDPQEASAWVKVELNVSKKLPLEMNIETRGVADCSQLLAYGVFCGTFTQPEEQYVAHLPTKLDQDFLVIPMYWPSPVPSSRLVNRWDVVMAGTPATLAGPYAPINPVLDGEYQVQLTAKGAGDFGFAVHALETVEALAVGDRRTGFYDFSLGPFVYGFDGQTDQRIVLDNLLPSTTTRIGSWSLMSIDGTITPVASMSAGDYEFAIPTNDRYYLIFSPPDITTTTTYYDFALRNVATQASELIFNQAITAEITSYGQRLSYTLEGSRDQQIIIDSLVPASSPASFTLLNPVGQEVPITLEQPVVLNSAGTWQVVVRGDQPGPVPFRVLNVADLPVLTNGQTIGGTTTAVKPDFYRIAMQAGQQLTMIQNGGNAFYQKVTGPSGQIIAPQSPGNFWLPQTGNGVLRMSHNGTLPEAEPYSYAVSLALSSPLASSGFNAEYSGTLVLPPFDPEHPDQELVATVAYPFTAAAGTPIVIDWLADPTLASSVVVKLRDPDGIDSGYSVSAGTKDSNVIVLSKSGTYEVRLKYSGGTGNTFAFRVLDLSAAPLIALGDSFSGTLTGYRTLARRVMPQAGDRLFLESTKVSTAPYANVRVYQSEVVANPYRTDRDEWTFEVQATQPHYILVEQNTSAALDVALQTNRLQDAEILPMGTPINLTLPTASGKLFKFSAPAGQQYFIDQITSYSPVYEFHLADAKGDFLPLGVQSPFDIEIGSSDEHYLLVQSSASAPLSFSFVITPLPVAATPIVFGVPQTAVLNSVSERKAFTFSGEEGQLVYFDGLDPASGATRLWLYDELNSEIDEKFRIETADYTTADHHMYALPRTGDYRIVVGGKVGTFDFRLVDPRTAQLVSLDTNFTGSIPAGLGATLWRFTAPLDQKLYIDSNATASMRFESRLQLYKSNGQNGGFSTAAVDNDIKSNVDRTGEQYLVAEGSTLPYSYDLRIRTPDLTTVVTTIGSLLTGQMDDPTETDEYTFTGTRDQHVMLDRINTINATITLLQQDGTTLNDAGDHSYLLPASGVYRVRITIPYPQSYWIYLRDAATQPLLPLNTPVTGSTSAADVKMFRLPGTAGQRLTFDSQTLSGATSNVRWLLYSPQGTEVFDVPFSGGDQTVTLAESGNYLLSLRAPSGTISYGFQVNSVVQTPVTSSGLDQTYSGNLAASQVANVNFTVNAGQRVYLDVLDRTSFQPTVRLFGPGDVVVTSSVTQDGWISLPYSGSYRLQLTSGVSATSYNLRLIDASQLTPLTIGQNFTITLDQAHESLVWAFDATVGDSRFFDLTQAAFGGTFTLQQPDGTSINLNASHSSPVFTSITQTGRHYLVLKGAAIGTPVTGAAAIRDPAQATTIFFDTTISGTLSPGAAYQLYGVELQAGDRLFVEPLTWTSPNFGLWRLFEPTGSAISPPSPNNLSSPFAITAQKTGTYTLLLAAAGSSPFDYSFRMKKLSVEEVTGFPYDHGFDD